MEIFNTVRSQQTHTTMPQGPEAGGRSVSQPHKTADISPQEEAKQAAEKGDNQRLKKELQEITDQLNKEMNPLNTSIRFGFDDSTEELFVSVIDTSNDQVIRKIPSEEAMKLAAKMRELVGMIFDKKG
ncbi:possible flagellar protein [Hydrogenimonas sp.]|nr:possible flagellar protein [Hydrogenimonas sp.]